MAIRKRNNHQQKLSPAQVQEIRLKYYHGCIAASQLAYDYQVSESLMKDAIYGKRGYANIPDPEKLEPKDKDPRVRSELKSFAKTDFRSQQRRDKRQSEKVMLDLMKQGYMPQETPLHLQPSPANIDWKEETRKAKVSQNRHYKGWDE